ncbi:hypothetical protein HN446_00530 [bacterium]|nr:hypothetical protein [bacterium]
MKRILITAVILAYVFQASAGDKETCFLGACAGKGAEIKTDRGGKAYVPTGRALVPGKGLAARAFEALMSFRRFKGGSGGVHTGGVTGATDTGPSSRKDLTRI